MDHRGLVRAEYEAYPRQVYWLMPNTAAIERRVRDGRSCNVVNDVGAFRAGVERLLAEVQRIKATGDYDAGRVVDAIVRHPCDFEQQMLEWSGASRNEAS